MQFKYLWKISSKKNNLESLDERKIFRPHFTQQRQTLNAWFILWFIGFVIAWPRSAERGSLLTRRTDKRMHAHLCTIRRKLRMLLRPSSMFLKDAIRFCAPNRFAETSSAYGHVCARPRTCGPKMGSFGLQQNERASGRATGRDSMRQKAWSAPTTNSFLGKVAAVPTVVAISAFELQ